MLKHIVTITPKKCTHAQRKKEREKEIKTEYYQTINMKAVMEKVRDKKV